MKKIILVSIFLMSLMIVNSASAVVLYAGQTIDAGNIEVNNDGENLYVEYITSGDWELMETHLYVGKTNPDTLTTAPGKFPYSGESSYVIPLDEIDSYEMETNKKGKITGNILALEDFGVEEEDIIYIAAHATVRLPYEVEEYVTVTYYETLTAPHYGDINVSTNQGLDNQENPVAEIRSDPAAALNFDSNHLASDFFSLGFGGEYIMGFTCPLVDGEGDDIRIIEDTWGTSYPLEIANVSVSSDGINWVFLGTADNTDHGDTDHTQTYFDLTGLGISDIKYIKVVDISDINDFTSKTGADGYDLNAIEALHDCTYSYEVEELQNVTYYQHESAWGNGTDFTHKNWAMYFEYEIENFCVEETLWQIGDKEISQMENPMDEFNYPGYGLSGGPLPEFDNPFIVGTSLDSNFPWNSNVVKNYATDFDVEFYHNENSDVKLTVAWSPGKSATEQKEVFVDESSLGTTTIILGTSVSGWYNSWEVYEHEFDFELSEGYHTLNFKHLMGDGTAWDFVKLERVCSTE
ncbi:hypothetical protein C0585_05975 [Candidatus Woesearchaeota archaeon]|nr:MAG: hypothetical protein C0585_05975 [Candidatus Woesearchaeota archaeon]